MVDAVARKFTGAGSSEDEVTLDACIDDLDDDFLVGEAYNEAVLRSVAEKRGEVLSGKCANKTYYLFLAWLISLLRA